METKNLSGERAVTKEIEDYHRCLQELVQTTEDSVSIDTCKIFNDSKDISNSLESIYTFKNHHTDIYHIQAIWKLDRKYDVLSNFVIQTPLNFEKLKVSYCLPTMCNEKIFSKNTEGVYRLNIPSIEIVKYMYHQVEMELDFECRNPERNVPLKILYKGTLYQNHIRREMMRSVEQ